MIAVQAAEVAEAACRALLEITPVSVHPVSAAPHAAVYRVTLPDRPVTQAIVKVWAVGAHWKAHKEAYALRSLTGAAGFGVPHLLACGAVPDRNAAAVVMNDLGPFTLGQVGRTGGITRTEQLTLLGRLLAAFHTTPRPAPGPLITAVGGRREIADLRAYLPAPLVEAAGEQLERVAEMPAGEVVWCHGDLHPENVILTGQRPYLVDFEQSALAPPEWDIAQTAVTTDALTPPELNAICAGYGRPLSPRRLGDLVTFHALRGWRWAARHEGRDAALWQARLQLALARYPGPDKEGTCDRG
ncbi:phosphotransferase [Streptosporangium sp. NPDC000509]|uniref:phosphotransferase n=1 Tax=Streptosporangium sp. NPDC000509 TaxID=3366186 RepID=UPI003677C323